MATPHIELKAVTIDCSDAARLAEFYAEFTGGRVTPLDDDNEFVRVSMAGGDVRFQSVNSYTPPQWPGQEHPQQAHLDFGVDDVEAAVKRAEKLGAIPAIEQPDAEHYMVMTDPEGHPFCLKPSSA